MAEQQEVTVLLDAVSEGDRQAAEQLLPLVYEELRKLAVSRLARTPPGNTLQATALVHEAYLRLVGDADPGWNSRGHFFGAAACAMRNILVEQARRKGRLKRGGDHQRQDIEPDQIAAADVGDDLLAIDNALKKLEVTDSRCAQVVMLRFFAGLTEQDIALAMDVSERTVRRDWQFARTWMQRELSSMTDDGATAG